MFLEIIIEIVHFVGPGTQVALEDALKNRVEELANRYGYGKIKVPNPSVSITEKGIIGSLTVEIIEK